MILNLEDVYPIERIIHEGLKEAAVRETYNIRYSIYDALVELAQQQKEQRKEKALENIYDLMKEYDEWPCCTG